ncbi:hypothetical protein GCM10028791_03690 [Echinicola sediminis]
MTFVDDILKKIFPKDEKAVSHRENTKYTEEDRKEIKLWMMSAEGESAFDAIYGNYQLQKKGEETTPEIHVYRSPYANGIAIFYDLPFNPKTFSKLFFAFGERIVDLGYDRVSIEKTVQEKAQGVNITEKQYLKPIPTLMAGQTDQLFGNISIEKVSVNHQPQMIKILVTVYSDRLYTQARSFESLVEVMFNHQ